MRYQTETSAGWPEASQLPPRMDCETAALLRGFLTPILENATSWEDLSERLAAKGYGVAFAEGHLVIVNAESHDPVSTGADMGVPLRHLSQRLGRPCVKVHQGGHSGDLG
ncbi:hypothetical protein ACOXXX_14525 [Thalassococcus sp. BH17M4-6]|uniref:hypothetical protein n=1 Tax=Thalassococcus sp. BH17M4-6 TaxID=3413148 RepID=UPI003BDEAFBE